MANRWGNNGSSERLYLGGGPPKSLQMVTAAMKLKKKMLAAWKESYDQPRWKIKKQRHYFANKGPFSQSYGFSSSHVWMWELDHKESWVLKSGCFWTVVLEKTLESPLNCKEIQPVHPKGNQYWIFIGRTDAEAPIFWPPEATHWKRPWCWERLRAVGERDDRGWNDWMASLTWWTWVWATSRSWWKTRKPVMLQSMGLQRVGHDWVTEVNWTDLLFMAALKGAPLNHLPPEARKTCVLVSCGTGAIRFSSWQTATLRAIHR